MFRGVVAGLKEQISSVADKLYLRALKQQLVGYVQVMLLEMLTHLFDDCTFGAMDLDQLEASLNEACVGNDHVNDLIRKLDGKWEKLNTLGIVVSNQQMVMMFVKQMYHSGNFDKQE